MACAIVQFCADRADDGAPAHDAQLHAIGIDLALGLSAGELPYFVGHQELPGRGRLQTALVLEAAWT